MKKLGKMAVMSLLVLASLTSATMQVSAKDTKYRSVNLIINEVPVTTDVMPVIVGNRTLAPLRVISESLGVSVDYNDVTRGIVVTGKGIKVEMTLDKNQVKVNGETQVVEVAPQNINGRTMLPVRFLADVLKCSIEWNPKTSTVVVKGGVDKPKGSVDQFGREIRTTNLPKNSDFFMYIAKDVPNWVYDKAYELATKPIPAWDYYGTKNYYVSPKGIYEDKDPNKKFDIANIYEMVTLALNNNLNIDYRTIDANKYATINSKIYDERTCTMDLKENALQGVDFYKKYGVISSAEIKVLPETFWKGEAGMYHVNAWVKLTVAKAPPLSSGKRFDDFGGMSNPTNLDIKNKPAKEGVVYEGVVALKLRENGNSKNYDPSYPYTINYNSAEVVCQLVDNRHGGAKPTK